MEDKKVSVDVGGGFCGMLTIAFIVLKLCGVIDWSWVWVVAPIWIPFAFVISVCIICLIVGVIVGVIVGIIKILRL